MNYYSPPKGRSEPDQMQDDIRVINGNAIFDTLLRVVSGLVAVLNEDRQILAVNETMLQACGFEDANQIHGLRTGEALNCVHAHEAPGGCGHSEYCSTCGAALAIVAALGFDKPAEKTCAATVQRGDRKMEIVFSVRAVPITLPDQKVLLLFMQDITSASKWAALEHAFFHDINNILTGLGGATELMAIGDQHEGLAKTADQLVLRLKREMDMQQVLSKSKNEFYQLSLQPIDLTQFIKEVTHLFCSHPAAQGKHLDLPIGAPNQVVMSDYSLLLRVISNMLTNAFEASREDQSIRLWIEQNKGTTSFHVWNEGVIDPNVQKRIFQRHFSTKAGDGRGIGTYAMKLFTEEFLMGEINFISTQEKGTEFILRIH